jgi:hypothetical protein
VRAATQNEDNSNSLSQDAEIVAASAGRRFAALPPAFPWARLQLHLLGRGDCIVVLCRASIKCNVAAAAAVVRVRVLRRRRPVQGLIDADVTAGRGP